MAIIMLLAPRLIDPRESLETVLQMFRFSEDKYKVEEAYKHRLQLINSKNLKSEFARNNDYIFVPRAGRGGRSRPMSMPDSSYFRSVFRRYQGQSEETSDGNS